MQLRKSYIIVGGQGVRRYRGMGCIGVRVSFMQVEDTLSGSGLSDRGGGGGGEPQDTLNFFRKPLKMPQK